MHDLLLEIGMKIVFTSLAVINLFGGNYVLIPPSETAQIQQQPAAAPALGAYNPSGGGTYRLSGSIGTVNTSITLSSFKEPVSNVPYTMSYLNSDVAYGTLDPQTVTSEFISFTGITQNSSGSATLTGVTRGLNRTNVGDTCTASSTFKQPHSGQSIFILSNSPCLYSEYVTKRNAETISGTKTFATTSIPRLDSTYNYAVGDELKLVTYGQLASTSFSGTVNASETQKGIVELATNLESASSTSLGSTLARLVIPASLSTSSCQVAQFGNNVVSSSTGKIGIGCFDQTLNYTFSGTNAFNGTTTLATTTINGQSTLATTTFSSQVNFNASTTIAAMATESFAINVNANTTSTSTGFTLTTARPNQPVIVSYSGWGNKSGDGTSTWGIALLIDGVVARSLTVGSITNASVNYFFGGSISYATSTLSVGSHTIQYRTVNGPVGSVAGDVNGFGLTIK